MPPLPRTCTDVDERVQVLYDELLAMEAPTDVLGCSVAFVGLGAVAAL